jgi:hypothetical protein
MSSENKDITIDVHITTCNHTSVKCRDRQGLPSWSNIKSWTSQERIEISKLSIESIKSFVNQSTQKKQLKNFSLLDDGSDIPAAVEWLESIQNLNVIRYPHRGSSFGINEYQKTITSDLVFHIEDDHICFNPFKTNIVDLCHRILTSEQASRYNIKVLTLRSGLPSHPDNLGIKGGWGPIGAINIDGIPLILYNAMGNAHHIMLSDTYNKFFPLNGNTGGCEAYMNRVMLQHGFKNAEIQDFIYAFHSHTLSYSVDTSPSSFKWNRSAEGFEYGIRDMDLYLKSGKPFICNRYINYPENEEIITIADYNYA